MLIAEDRTLDFIVACAPGGKIDIIYLRGPVGQNAAIDILPAGVVADNPAVQEIIAASKEIHGGQRAETLIAPVTAAI